MNLKRARPSAPGALGLRRVAPVDRAGEAAGARPPPRPAGDTAPLGGPAPGKPRRLADPRPPTRAVPRIASANPRRLADRQAHVDELRERLLATRVQARHPPSLLSTLRPFGDRCDLWQHVACALQARSRSRPEKKPLWCALQPPPALTRAAPAGGRAGARALCARRGPLPDRRTAAGLGAHKDSSADQNLGGGGPGGPPPPPHPRTKWTRRAPHPVLIEHAASLAPY